MVRPSSVFSSLLYLASCLPVHLGLPVPWWLPCGDHLNPQVPEPPLLSGPISRHSLSFLQGGSVPMESSAGSSTLSGRAAPSAPWLMSSALMPSSHPPGPQ